MYNYLRDKINAGTTVLATAWIPQTPAVAVFAGCSLWYGRQVALTYAPGYLANYFINLTVAFMGTATVGKVIGATIVAPVMTPSMTPFIATAVGLAMFYCASVIGNLIKKIFS